MCCVYTRVCTAVCNKDGYTPVVTCFHRRKVNTELSNETPYLKGGDGGSLFAAGMVEKYTPLFASQRAMATNIRSTPAKTFAVLLIMYLRVAAHSAIMWCVMWGLGK